MIMVNQKMIHQMLLCTTDLLLLQKKCFYCCKPQN